MKIPKNMGGTDRVLRGLVGGVLAVLVYLGLITGTWAIVAGVAAVALILTSIVGFCPPYALFGWNTCWCVAENTPPTAGPGTAL